MEIIVSDIQTRPTIKLPYGKITLAPVSDIQYGAQGCDLDKFKTYIEKAQSKNAYFVGLGDYVDMPSPSGRAKIKGADFYDSVQEALEAQAMAHLEKVWDILKPTKGKWLSLLEGHHFYDFQDGSTTDTILAERLDTPFLGTSALVDIVIGGNAKGGSQSATCELFMHHGEGSGRSIAAPLNKILPLVPQFPTVDIFLIAHYHSKVSHKFPVYIPVYRKSRNKKAPVLKRQERLVACTGGYLDGYQVGSTSNGRPKGSYVEKALMPARALGGLFIDITPKRERKNGNDYSYLEIEVSY